MLFNAAARPVAAHRATPVRRSSVPNAGPGGIIPSGRGKPRVSVDRSRHPLGVLLASFVPAGPRADRIVRAGRSAFSATSVGYLRCRSADGSRLARSPPKCGPGVALRRRSSRELDRVDRNPRSPHSSGSNESAPSELPSPGTEAPTERWCPRVSPGHRNPVSGAASRSLLQPAPGTLRAVNPGTQARSLVGFRDS